MTLHRVTLQDCPPQPWRNGGGTTRELLTWPLSSPAQTNWHVRVSVAHIARDGPFSPFPGVQRCFAVLHGQGVRLGLPDAGRGTVTLTPADDPLSFDGEAAPMCHLIKGPTDDLNLMAPRDAGRARLQRALPGSGIDGATRWRGLFAVEHALLDHGDHTESVGAGTLVWSDDADLPPWTLHHGSRAFWLSLEA